MSNGDSEKIRNAIDIAIQYGGIDGDHHKAWVIDQMIRALTGCPLIIKGAKDCNGESYTYEAQGESKEYTQLVKESCSGEDGPNTYEWNEGITP